MPRSLTERQRRFVEAHLVTRNAKQAALEAGHDPEWAPAASVSPDETDFAANGIMGADFLVPTVPQLTLGARYRLLFVNTASSDCGISNGGFISHVFTANATWHF